MDALDYAKSFTNKVQYGRSVSLEGRPKGCYIYAGYMYFNMHPFGGTESGPVKSICKKGNT